MFFAKKSALRAEPEKKGESSWVTVLRAGKARAPFSKSEKKRPTLLLSGKFCVKKGGNSAAAAISRNGAKFEGGVEKKKESRAKKGRKRGRTPLSNSKSQY